MSSSKNKNITKTKKTTKSYLTRDNSIRYIKQENIKDTHNTDTIVVKEEKDIKATKKAVIKYKPRKYTEGVRNNDKIKERLIELVAEDTYTVDEICAIAGTTTTTFYEWLKKDAEFSKEIKNARTVARQNFGVIAKNSLRRLIEGFETTDIIEAEKLNRQGEKIKTVTRTTKIHKPDTAAVIFTLTNVDPTNWKNRQNVSGEITTNEMIRFEDLENYMQDLSDEDLEILKRIALNIQKLKE